MVYFKSIVLLTLFVAKTSMAANTQEEKISSSQKQLRRRLDYASFFSYYARSSVSDHAAIGLDQGAMETQLKDASAASFENARGIYEKGGNSKSYALVKITTTGGLSESIPQGQEIQGKNLDSQAVVGKAYEDLKVGDTTIKIQYKTNDSLDSHVGCRVGGLFAAGEALLDDCFKNSGIMANLKTGTEFDYEYARQSENLNGRTLKGFSEQAEAKMGTCPTCPYDDYAKFYEYYGKFDYANHWVTSAFDKKKTEFKNGNADFSKYVFTGLQEVIKKGTAYMSVWMYVIREFEDALDDCSAECIDCNSGSVHAWDEGVAFYHGTTGENLVHALANKRCANFNVCGTKGNELEGTAKVNYDLYQLFVSGQQNILSGNCDAARVDKEAIVPIMTIPLVQGTLRYAYIRDRQPDGNGEKEEAEGAVFAAAVLPFVHACSSVDAKIIYDYMAVGTRPDKPDFVAVKSAFERNYKCMKINGGDVGGLWDAASNNYFKEASPFYGGYGSESNDDGKNALAITLGVVLGVILFCAIGGILFMRKKEKDGQPVFAPTENKAGVESATPA